MPKQENELYQEFEAPLPKKVFFSTFSPIGRALNEIHTIDRTTKYMEAQLRGMYGRRNELEGIIEGLREDILLKEGSEVQIIITDEK